MQGLTKELRKTKSDAFINLTVGSWPSPYWLKSADSIWRAGADMGLTGAGNDHERWLTYRDNECYKNVVQRAPLFPLNSVMYHGISWANNGPANNAAFNSTTFKSDVRAYFGSGTGLQELYLSPGKLAPSDWRNLAECIKWSRENVQTLSDSHWVGGSPGDGEIYGWASWQPDKGVITLRNPSASSQQISVTLNDVLELSEAASPSYYLRSPWIEDAADVPLIQDARADLNLTLDPFEVMVLEATPEAPPSWHRDGIYREWALRLPSGMREPNDPFGRNPFPNLMAFATGYEANALSGRLLVPFGFDHPAPVSDGMEIAYSTREDLGNTQLIRQVSTDLVTWHEGSEHFIETDRSPQGNGTVLVRARLVDAYLTEPQAFVRLLARTAE